MQVLALDAALAGCSAAVVAGDAVLAARSSDAAHGQASLLPPMVAAVLAEAGLAADALELIAVTVGPGGFTGLRAALALAQGIGLAAGVPVVGVTVGEALADALPALGARALWVAVDSRRGHVFLERDGTVRTESLAALPAPGGKVAVAGDAAVAVAAALAARGEDVMLTGARRPAAIHVARVGARRHSGGLPPRLAQPLYVDPPAARLPAGGLRPPPR